VAEILRQQAQLDRDLSVLGFVDENPNLQGKTVNDLPVLGDWTWFDGLNRSEIAVICAVGVPSVCRRLTEKATSLGLAFANAISPLASLSNYAKIGEGVVMFPNTIASTDSVLGDYCILNVAATVSHDTKIGRFANINPGVHLAGNVTIGEGCNIGMGANVIQGISIGEWTTVGAGAVVIRDLPSNVTAVGVPAAVIKTKEQTSNEQSSCNSG
jgi:sugar O-acyltransferase (sialic acid O-acetyltransferase NeuD family)